MPSQAFNHDKELAEFFTDVEHLRDWFNNAVAAPELARRILVIHGVGGVGKSSLLRMFRLHCKSVNVPVALASGDDSKSALDVLTHWTDDLKADGIAFPAFGKTFEHYRAIQAKVENESAKTAEKLAKGATKTIIETAASTIPGVGPLIGKLGGMGAEALVDWMRGFLTKPDIDLLLDPAKKLTDDFLDDLGKIAEKKRIVLMLDTFEQMTALDDWARDVAQRLGQGQAQPLLVIAGRALPNWNRAWSGWMATAQVEELKPMTEDVMRELIQRYYATMRGGEPNPTQVDAIIRFARGLPMVVTSAVQLWVKYGVEDFQSVKAEIVANLVDRLMEGVPKELIPALEAAAIVRWFDQPILRAVTGLADVRDVYNELRRFPFVRTRVEGLALHDAVREIMDENLRAQDSERHCELHERAAAYFEKRLEKATGEEAERLGLERLYHRVRADEEAGIKLFQEMAEELTRYRLVNRLRALLNDVNTYPLERENSRLWREYYDARVAHLEFRWEEAQQIYQEIGANDYNEKKLRSYALCDLGELWSQRKFVVEPGGAKQAIQTIEKSLSLTTAFDSKLVLNYFNLGSVYQTLGEHDECKRYFELALDAFRQSGDEYGTAFMWGHLAERHRVWGNWREGRTCRTNGLEMLTKLGNRPSLRSHLVGGLLPFSMGHYAESERGALEKLTIEQNLGYLDLLGPLRDLGLILGFEDRYQEAQGYFAKCLDNAKSLKLDRLEDTTALRFEATMLIRKGDFFVAESYLARILEILEQTKYTLSLPEVLFWWGILCETRKQFDKSSDYFKRSLDYKWTNRRYFECAALTGLVRVKHAQGEHHAIPPLLAEAEQLAQQYEYNDHLASLRVTQAQTFQVFGNLEGLTALDYFKQAMIYALRYNRFLLDEVLSGRPQGTPLRPIIPYCLERGEEGRKMLIALRDWWKTGVNDIGTPRPDTISPIQEGIALLEAERIAREREPGDGSLQKSVVEQIEAVL
ncbi:MAG: hypothetical protein FJ009_20745 [Chloroflexi bacterium]|nr:hypothetical protein [Chloroflexota bacterium]